jgi:foldase protein PrsA
MNGIFALILTVLIGPAAAQNDRDVVKVNGTTIRQSEVMQRLWERYGPETLDEMVDELLLRQAIAAKKIEASSSEIDKRVAKMRGQFSDPRLFETQLAESGSTMEKLRKDIGFALARQELIVSARKISVSEEEIKKAFEDHRAELGTPEGLHLRHILVATEDAADDIVKQVKAGADFKKLAAEKSLAPTGKINGGDYGFISPGMLPPDIEKIAYSMKKDELRIMPSDKGVHILQALERRPAAPAKFETVKDDLRDILLQAKLKQAMPEFMTELRKKADIQPQGQ